MFNPDKLLGGLISGALGGGSGGRRAGKASLAIGALGVAVATVEHLMGKCQTGHQVPPVSTGSNPPPPPGGKARNATPPPPPPGMPSGPPAAQSSRKAAGAVEKGSSGVLLIRAMIASACADGELDTAEKSRILKRLESVDLDEEETAFIKTELDNPRAADDLIAEVTSPAIAQQVYAVSLMAVNVDTKAEKTYLRNLADQLNLSEADRAKVHGLLEIPEF